jgi:hypothetical protein
MRINFPVLVLFVLFLVIVNHFHPWTDRRPRTFASSTPIPYHRQRAVVMEYNSRCWWWWWWSGHRRHEPSKNSHRRSSPKIITEASTMSGMGQVVVVVVLVGKYVVVVAVRPGLAWP